MESSVKRLSQQTHKSNLILISLAAALTSLQLTFLNPILQFTVTAGLFTGFLIAIEKTLSGKKSQRVISAAMIAVIVSLGVQQWFDVAATLFIVSLAVLPFKECELYLQAAIAHGLDVFSSLIAMENEANPAIAFLADLIGLQQSLAIFKLFFVSLPLLYIWRVSTGYEEQLLLKVILVLGVSMASRNLILVLA